MTEKKKKQSKRSPNFPGINLEEAIQSAKKIYDADGRAGSFRATVLKHLGYKSEHGVARMILSALKKFNLIEEKNKNINLTRPAEIIFISNDENKIKQNIRECALSPNIYKKLWDQYSDTGLPSDAALKDKLVWEFDFNEKSVDGFLENFRKTLNYAGIEPGMEPEDEHDAEETEKNKADIPDLTITKKKGEKILSESIKDYLIPRKNDKIAVLRLENPVTEEDIKVIKQWLDLLGTTIVQKVDMDIE